MSDLRALAEAARTDSGAWIEADYLACFIDGDEDQAFEDADAAYIAACSPDRILALLDVVDAARALDVRPDRAVTSKPALDALRAALDRLP